MLPMQEEKYRAQEEKLSQDLAEQFNTLMQNFCAENGCQVMPVMKFGVAVIPGSALVSHGLYFNVITEEHAQAAQKEEQAVSKVPTIIGTNGKVLVN